MQIDKSTVLDMLKNRGDHTQAAAAERELPDQVDTDEHQDLLGKLGVDPSDLLGGAGGIGSKLGL